MAKVLQSVPAREEPFRYVKTGDTLALSDWLHFQLDEAIAENAKNPSGSSQPPHQQLLLTSLLDELRDVSHKRSTLLHWAAYLGSSDMVEMLLHYGASTIVTEEDGKTPLHWAAFEGHLAVVDQLLNPPPQVIGVTPAEVQPYLMRDTLGHTPCHLAVMNEHKAVAMKFKNYNEVQRNGSVSPLRTSTPREQPQAQVPVPRAGASQQTSTRPSEGKPTNTTTAAGTAQTDSEPSSGPGAASEKGGKQGGEEVKETKGIVVSGAQPHGRSSTSTTASQGDTAQSQPSAEERSKQPPPAAPPSSSSAQPHAANSSQSTELHSSKVTTPTRNSRWEAARSNNPNSKPYILSTRTAAPPSLAGLKKLAEEEAASERREISRGMGPGGSAERWDDSKDSVEPVPMRFSKTQHSPGGIQTSAPYEAAASYDSVAAQEEDPYGDTAAPLDEDSGAGEELGAETDEEEARLRAEEEETEKRLALLQRRMRRQERAERLEQLRKEIGRTVTELVSEGQPLPTDLRQLLEDSRCLDKIQIQWVPRQETGRGGGGGRRREAGPTPQRSEEGSRARNRRNMNTSNDSAGRSSRSVSRSNAGEDDPRPSEAAPQPQPYHRSASQGLSTVRIPSTRFPPTTKLWTPRSSSRSASRQRRSASGGAGTARTWKPPTGVHQEPLGFPSHLITEKLKHQGSFAFVQYHDPLPSGPPPLPTRAVSTSDAPTRTKNGGFSTPNRTTAAAPNGGISATVAQSPFDR
jgi:hypothetical protein